MKQHGIYLDGKRIGKLIVEYNADGGYTAMASSDDCAITSMRLTGRNYTQVTDASVDAYVAHLGITKLDRVTRQEEPVGFEPERDNNWQQSRTGRRVWAYDTRIEDIHLAEIAYGMREGRFANQTLGLYTYAVGQHACHATAIGDPSPKARMAKLLHDAHESCLKDMPKPLRLHPGMADYNAACDARQRVINVWAGLDKDAHLTPDVKHADAVMLATERRDLMAPNEHPWASMKQPLPGTIKVWSQPLVVYMFLFTFERLAAQVCPQHVGEAEALRHAHEKLMREEGLPCDMLKLARGLSLC